MDYRNKLLRNTWVEINLDHIKNNLLKARTHIDEETKIGAVVKANAYGHGTPLVAEALIEAGADMLNVACLTEALELRKTIKDFPILIMGYTPDDLLEIAIRNNITLTIFSLKQGEEISRISKRLGKVTKVHLKIDTGFNRLGFKLEDEEENTIRSIEKIYHLENIYVEGIFSHLALVDIPIDKNQYRVFAEFVEKLNKMDIYIPIKHISDSIALVEYPEFQMNMVRPGAFLYGLEPAGHDRDKLGLKMALTFKTKITQIKKIHKGEGVSYGFNFIADRESLIATLPVGYADGYFRALSNKGYVSINGKKAPIIGRMCMDQCMVDVTDIEDVKEGNEVVLLGSCGNDSVDIMEVANLVGTNRNEVISMISKRVPRVYYKNGKMIKVLDYLLD